MVVSACRLAVDDVITVNPRHFRALMHIVRLRGRYGGDTRARNGRLRMSHFKAVAGANDNSKRPKRPAAKQTNDSFSRLFEHAPIWY